MKNIVICCDGTANDVRGAHTNVLRFYRSLVRDDSQIAYYDSGVGTLADPSLMISPAKSLGRSLDMAVGSSVMRQVCTAYRFLVRHWHEGDKVFLIGFSRGAYAVRALAGMLYRVGLVRQELEHLTELGWSAYSGADFKACGSFRYAFSQKAEVPIHFVGVWDTVSSFGAMTSFKTLPQTRNNRLITHIRHAVAMHERRVCFKPNLFGENNQDVLEVWFKGTHGDIGGGWPEEKSGLAKITLQWMYEEAQRFDCQLKSRQIQFFLGESEKQHSQVGPNPNQETNNSMTGLWHLLEFLPRREWDHTSKPEGMSWHVPNLYRPREIPEDAVIHPTAQDTAPKNFFRRFAR